MRLFTPRPALLLASAALALAPVFASAEANVTLERADARAEGQPPRPQREDHGSTFSRKLWNGSFDRAADASGAAARQLEGLDFGNCDEYRKTSPEHPQGQLDLYRACVQRSQDSKTYADQARKIQKQQNALSIVSKAADVAAIGAVGGVIYAEMGVKQQNQSGTYGSAANIQRMAGTASYASGAADLTMGAYAYVAQKNKLEQMKSAITGTKDGVKASSDPAVTNAMADAVEAAKKAAYSHMMWGAGKVAAGYGMMALAKRSQDQAAKMQSIQDDMELNQFLQARAAAQGPALAAAPVQIGGVGTAPYYQNANPQFVMPNTSAASDLASHTGPVTYTVPGGGVGASAAPTAAQSRALAAAAMGKVSGGGGGAGGGEGASRLPDTEDPAKEKSERSAKEAMGNAFETQLTGAGGFRPFAGGASAAAGKDEVPNLAALMGNGGAGTDQAGSQAATGLSPAAILQAASEGADGTEEGSLAGVNGKRDSSLFDINHAKLTKMFQVGNIGIPKNVEVK